MKFEEFSALTPNSMCFLLAWSLLWENGSQKIKECESSELVRDLTARLSGFCTESIIQEVISIAKQLATVPYDVLLEYIQQSRSISHRAGQPESGICPDCGTQVEYRNSMTEGDERCCNWVCPDCGATGQEMQRIHFVKHIGVHHGSDVSGRQT